MKRRETGFTIVELLIVIVVIAILAAIVIVAYNGIQTRAKDATITSAVKSWENIMEAYHAQNDTYPNLASGDGYVCLSASLPAGDGFNANQCAKDDSGWNITVDADFNADLSESVGALPVTVLPFVKASYWSGYDYFRGVLYYQNADGNSGNGLMYDPAGSECIDGDVTKHPYAGDNVQCIHSFNNG